MTHQSKLKVISIDDSDNEVKLTVSVGFGQPSSTDIFLGGAAHSSHDDSFSDFSLGTMKFLIGKQVVVRTTISDLPQNPNKTSATHSLNVGQPASAIAYSDNVAEGEIATYATTYIFIGKNSAAA